MMKIGIIVRFTVLPLFAGALGALLPIRVVRADIAGGGAVFAGIALGSLLIIGIFVAMIAFLAYLVLRGIAKKNDNK